MLLSSDGAVAPDVLAINAASAALMCSNIPWGGPVAAVRVAQIKGRLVINPPPSAAAEAPLSLLYAGSASQAVVVDLQVTYNPLDCSSYLASPVRGCDSA